MCLDVSTTRITIAGAGSVGCYVGGCLALAGRTVTLLARPRLAEPIAKCGLDISDLDGLQRHVAPSALRVEIDPERALQGAHVILVTVKGFDTQAMAALIAQHAPSNAAAVSFQNGAGNAETIARQLAGGQRAIPGMVPFNIVQTIVPGGPPHFHRGVSGTALIQPGVPGLKTLLDCPGFPAAEHDRLGDVLWSKLLINLNNALNALSGVPLKEQLSRRSWRRLLARQMREAMAVLKAEKIALAPIEGVHPRILPAILCLPDLIFKRVSRAMLAMDPKARSSMWEDLERRRVTEIEYLQGEILRRGQLRGIATPLIAKVYELIKDAERERSGAPCLSPGSVAVNA